MKTTKELKINLFFVFADMCLPSKLNLE